MFFRDGQYFPNRSNNIRPPPCGMSGWNADRPPGSGRCYIYVGESSHVVNEPTKAGMLLGLNNRKLWPKGFLRNVKGPSLRVFRPNYGFFNGSQHARLDKCSAWSISMPSSLKKGWRQMISAW